MNAVPTNRIPVAHIFLTLNIGGMEKVGIDLIRNINRDRFENHVICLESIGALGEQLEQSGISVTCLDRRPGKSWQMLKRLIGYIRRHGIQVVHTNNSAPHFWGGLAAKICGVKATIHTNHGRNAIWSARRVRLDKFSSRLSKIIVCVSADSAEKLVHQDGIPEHKVRVIPNGVDTEAFKPGDAPSELRRAIAIRDDDFVIGTIARLSTDKDQHTLIRALSLLHVSHPAMKLLIVGDGETRAELEKLIVELSLQDKVSMLGFRSDVIELLRLFDCYVLPSHTEGLSIALLEAMSAQSAVIATSVGGNIELISHSNDGFLVAESDPDDLASRLAQLQADVDLRLRLGVAARKKVEESFSIQAMARSYQSTYEELISA